MSFPSLSFLPRPLCCRSCGSEEASVRHIRRNSGHHEAAERGGNWYVDHYSYKMNCTVHFDVGTAWWDLSGREREDLTLFYARTLRSIHLFLPLLNGDQFHSYLTAQAQNAVPRIFVFITYDDTKPTKTRPHSLIYDYYTSTRTYIRSFLRHPFVFKMANVFFTLKIFPEDSFLRTPSSCQASN